jgi:hypothetical protein
MEPNRVNTQGQVYDLRRCQKVSEKRNLNLPRVDIYNSLYYITKEIKYHIPTHKAICSFSFYNHAKKDEEHYYIIQLLLGFGEGISLK